MRLRTSSSLNTNTSNRGFDSRWRFVALFFGVIGVAQVCAQSPEATLERRNSDQVAELAKNQSTDLIPSADSSREAADSAKLVVSERMQATLWVQTALEHRVACAQAFKLAEAKLREGLANPAWTAATEQGKNFARKPPAVILDVDETALDNSPFNARMVAANKAYDSAEWDRWCNELSAEAIPGAKEFIHYALRSGVAVFFVTNRDARLKPATTSNLAKALGISISSDRVMLKNERVNWTSDKSSRRAFVARSHRIVLLIGDDFNDFVYLGEQPSGKRNQAGEYFRTSWGHHWIMLPNPIYGNWEKAIYNYRLPNSKAAQLEIRHGSLKKKLPVAE